MRRGGQVAGGLRLIRIRRAVSRVAIEEAQVRGLGFATGHESILEILYHLL